MPWLPERNWRNCSKRRPDASRKMVDPTPVARRWMVGALVGIAVSLCSSGTAHAQAWPMPARVGVVGFVYQDVSNTGHLLDDGSMLRGYDSRSRSLLLTLDYAFTDRFSVTLGMPYLGSKYEGPEPS